MKNLLPLPVFFAMTVSAHAATGPVITAPDQTEGVLQRQLVQKTDIVRPLPNPRRSHSEDAKVSHEKPEHKPVDLATEFPLPAWLTKDGYMLPAKTDWDLTRLVTLGIPKVSQTYALDLTATNDYERRNSGGVMVAFEPVIMTPDDMMNEVIRSTLSQSYDMDVIDGQSGYEQLLSMAEGRVEVEPLSVSSESYDFPEEASENTESVVPASYAQTPAVGQVMGMDPAAAILNSLSQQQVSIMSPDQITALVLAAHGKPMNLMTQQAAAPSMPVANAAVMPGIPSLDYRGEDMPTPQVISAADVPAGSMPFSDSAVSSSAPPPPTVVGDGSNILMKGWRLGLTGGGAIGMYKEGDPGSIVEVSEGMVIGPLGAIQRLTMENGNIIAKFSSGEVMTSPATLLNMASL